MRPLVFLKHFTMIFARLGYLQRAFGGSAKCQTQTDYHWGFCFKESWKDANSKGVLERHYAVQKPSIVGDLKLPTLVFDCGKNNMPSYLDTPTLSKCCKNGILMKFSNKPYTDIKSTELQFTFQTNVDSLCQDANS